MATLTEKEHFTLDADNDGIYNALIATKPNNDKLLNAINEIILNTSNRDYFNNSLEITGPRMLKKFFTNEEKNNLELTHKVYSNIINRAILLKNIPIFISYDGYLKDQKTNNQLHYSILWKEKKVYNV